MFITNAVLMHSMCKAKFESVAGKYNVYWSNRTHYSNEA